MGEEPKEEDIDVVDLLLLPFFSPFFSSFSFRGWVYIHVFTTPIYSPVLSRRLYVPNGGGGGGRGRLRKRKIAQNIFFILLRRNTTSSITVFLKDSSFGSSPPQQSTLPKIAIPNFWKKFQTFRIF